MGGMTYSRFVHPGPVARDYWGPTAEIGHIAASVARGQGFSSPYWSPTGPTAEQPPVFPYLLAGVFKIFGIDTNLSAFVILSLDCLFSALTLFFVFLLGEENFGPGTGWLAAWGWAFWPSAALTPVTHLWHDSLSALLLTAAFWATLHIEDASRLAPWLGTGLLWALAALTNPALLAPFPFLLAWLFFRRRSPGKSSVVPIAACILVLILGIAPWIIRNDLTFGGRLFLIDDFGAVLNMGNHPGASAAVRSPIPLPTESPEEWQEYQRLGEAAYMAQKQREAVRYIRAHPATYARLCAERLLEFWVWTGAKQPFGRTLTALGAALVYFLLPAAGICGLFFSFRNRIPRRVPFLILLAAFPLVYLATAFYPRFRHPVEPALVVLGAYALEVTVPVFLKIFAPAGAGELSQNLPAFLKKRTLMGR